MFLGLAWKNSIHTSEKNAKLLKQYAHDMEVGINTNGAKKGSRSPSKVLSASRQVSKIIELIEERSGIKDITEIQDTDLHDVFHAMTTGEIKKSNGGYYKSVGDYASRFKAFWHWHVNPPRAKAGGVTHHPLKVHAVF